MPFFTFRKRFFQSKFLIKKKSKLFPLFSPSPKYLLLSLVLPPAMYLSALSEEGIWEFTLGSSSICKNNPGYKNALLFWASYHEVNLKTQGGPHKPFGARSFALFYIILVQDYCLQMFFAEHKMPIGENQK